MDKMNLARVSDADAADHKSALQEVAQRELNQLPRYKVISAEGPDHAPTFEVTVSIQDEKLGAGQGKSKKRAEQLAAQQALEKLADASREFLKSLREGQSS